MTLRAAAFVTPDGAMEYGQGWRTGVNKAVRGQQLGRTRTMVLRRVLLPADLPTSTVLARAPPLALARRLPLEDEEPRESEEELLMLSLSCPRPQEVGAQPPRSGLRLKVGELSDVVSGALLSMLAMPSTPKMKSVSSLQD